MAEAEDKDKLKKTGGTTARTLQQGERKTVYREKGTQRNKHLQHKWTVTVRVDMVVSVIMFLQLYNFDGIVQMLAHC